MHLSIASTLSPVSSLSSKATHVKRQLSIKQPLALPSLGTFIPILSSEVTVKTAKQASAVPLDIELFKLGM